VTVARSLVSVTALALASASLASPSRAQTTPTDAVPIPAVQAILDTFRSHALVALADAHGSEQLHAFRLSLI